MWKSPLGISRERSSAQIDNNNLSTLLEPYDVFLSVLGFREEIPEELQRVISLHIMSRTNEYRVKSQLIMS